MCLFYHGLRARQDGREGENLPVRRASMEGPGKTDALARYVRNGQTDRFDGLGGAEVGTIGCLPKGDAGCEIAFELSGSRGC